MGAPATGRRRVALVLLVVSLGAGGAIAAPSPPKRSAAGEARYDGPRLAFSLPAAAQVKESSDVVAEYALDVAVPGAAPTRLRVLLSSAKVVDADVESVGAAWRDARLRNRASWGVSKRGEQRAEVTHLGARRFVRMVDQLGSVLGTSTQIMMCGSASSRLVCGVVSGAGDRVRTSEAVMVRLLESIVVKKSR